MKSYRQKGFDLSPQDVGAPSLGTNLGLYASREEDGLWSAWVEDDAPPAPSDPTVKIFVGSSAFQAQLKAIRSMREGGPSATSFKPPTSGEEPF